MNNKSLVKLSNIIGIVSIILLIYWVFVFISITVFGLKVFRENITETFYLSIIGILALMFGALMINVMFNLTRIAEKHNQDKILGSKAYKKGWILVIVSFPLILGLLLGGDYLTAKKKEKMLIASAKSIIETNREKTKKIVNYSFDKTWIMETCDILSVYSKTDTYFPNVSVIVADSLYDSPVFLSIRHYYRNYRSDDTTQFIKNDFILRTTKEERAYLNSVFYENAAHIRFCARKGRYELFYPYFEGEKKIVLYFSDYQEYGKIGS